jgi:hypothetical protein
MASTAGCRSGAANAGERTEKKSTRENPRNLLKSLDSDERIQGNTRKSNPQNRGLRGQTARRQENPNGSAGPMRRALAPPFSRATLLAFQHERLGDLAHRRQVGEGVEPAMLGDVLRGPHEAAPGGASKRAPDADPLDAEILEPSRGPVLPWEL